MTIKVEVNPIPNSNQNKIYTYNEVKQNSNSQPVKRNLNRTFIVPKENTDEFVTKIQKKENNKLMAVGLGAIAGAPIGVGLCVKLLNKYPKIDYTALGAITAGTMILTSLIPYSIKNIQERNLFKKLDIKEIKE